MSIHLGEECEAECLELMKGLDIGFAQDDDKQAKADAARVCSSSRSPRHVCKEILALIQKWTYKGYGS